MIEKQLPKQEEKKQEQIKRKNTADKEPEVQLEQSAGTFDQYFDKQTNLTHKQYINLIKPITFDFPNQVIEASLLIWLEKKDLPK